MKVEFKNKTLKQIYYNQRIWIYPKYIEDKFIYLVNYIMDSETLQDLYQWRSLHLEKLQWKEYKNKHSIRVNDQRRLIIEIIVEPELTTIIVDLVDYH